MARPKVPVGKPRPAESNSDHRVRLESLRDRLAIAVTTAAHRDLAPLAARYQAVLTELANLPDSESKGADGIDDLTAARSRRRANAAHS